MDILLESMELILCCRLFCFCCFILGHCWWSLSCGLGLWLDPLDTRRHFSIFRDGGSPYLVNFGSFDPLEAFE